MNGIRWDIGRLQTLLRDRGYLRHLSLSERDETAAIALSFSSNSASFNCIAFLFPFFSSSHGGIYNVSLHAFTSPNRNQVAGDPITEAGVHSLSWPDNVTIFRFNV